jgi:hypothetical protein
VQRENEEGMQREESERDFLIMGKEKFETL